MTITEAEIGTLTYGVEIEYTGVMRDKVAKAIAEEVGGTAHYEGQHLNNWVVTMADGRKWQVESDGSVTGSMSGRGGEVVTPVMTIADMDMLQRVIRRMREIGAKVDKSCGAHVHVGAADMTAKQIQNLVKIFYKQEELIFKACGVQETRLNNYAHRTRKSWIDRIAGIKGKVTMAKLHDAYYNGGSDYGHYNSARYRALNLHNIWQGNKHTVEFRLFEGTLHAGEIKANLHLALCLVLMAKRAKSASIKHQRDPELTTSQKYDFRVFLLRLGMNGNLFKNTRMHLTKRLEGSAAWKYEPAETSTTSQCM